MEKIYVDYCSGHFEAWIYAEARRYTLSLHELGAIKAYARKHHYKLVLTAEAKLFEAEAR